MIMTLNGNSVNCKKNLIPTWFTKTRLISIFRKNTTKTTWKKNKCEIGAFS